MASATPCRAPEPQLRTKQRQWSKLRPRYHVLISFIDVLYSALLGYGFYEAAQAYRTGNFITVFLLSFSTLYLIGDYVDARLFTEEYQYRSATRFFYDLAIGVVLFVAFIAATLKSTKYLLLMAMVFLLGGKWCFALDREYKDRHPLKSPTIIAQGHLYAAVIFMGRWYRIRNHVFITARDVLVMLGSYAAWAILVVFVEIIFALPTAEADLFPNFPIGRIMRKSYRLRRWGVIYRRFALRGLRNWGSAQIDTISDRLRRSSDWFKNLSDRLKKKNPPHDIQ